MKHSLEQAVVKRKWSADKSAGPLVLLAEWVQKRLIQHGWPCEYQSRTVWDDPIEDGAVPGASTVAVLFKHYPLKPALGPDFWDAFDAMVRILAHEKDLRAYRDGCRLYLDGVYHVNKYGVIKRGAPPPPF